MNSNEISYRDFRENLADVLNRIEYRDESFVVTRRGKPVAYIAPEGNMKLYLVKRTDEWDYDEHDAVAVRAQGEEQAVAIAISNCVGMAGDNVAVTEIQTDGDEAVILASFNAG